MILEDTKCKICKTDLVWQGSVTNGHMACPNQYCHSNMTDEEFNNTRTSTRVAAEELEYDAADD